MTIEEKVEEQVAEPSLRDVIESTMAEQRTAETEANNDNAETEAEKKDTVEEVEEVEDAVEETDDNDGVMDEETATEDQTEEVKDTVEETDDNDGVTKAPNHFDEEDSKLFNEISDEASKSILLKAHKNLNKGYTEKFEELANTRKEHDLMRSIMSPLSADIAASGISEAQAMQTLVNAQIQLTQNPINGLHQIVATMADPKAVVTQLAKNLGIGIEDTFDDESFDKPSQDVVNLQNQVNEMNQMLQQQNAMQVQNTTTEANNQINLFSQATDDTGAKLYPYFEEVRDNMSILVTNNPSLSLSEAYGTAIYMDDNVRNQVIKTTQNKAIDNEKRKANIAKSKQGSRTVKTVNSAPRDDSVQRSLREDLEAELKKQKA